MAESDAAEITTPDVFVYDDIANDSFDAAKGGAPKELLEKAARLGLKRKRLIRGEGGFYVNRTVFPAGYEVAPHSHDHNELMIILKGGCSFDDGVVVGANDSMVIHANYRYGFKCGPEGMEFFVIRYGETKYKTKWS